MNASSDRLRCEQMNDRWIEIQSDSPQVGQSKFSKVCVSVGLGRRDGAEGTGTGGRDQGHHDIR